MYRRTRSALPAPERLVGDPDAVDWKALREHAAQVARTSPQEEPRLHEWHARCLDALRSPPTELRRYQSARPCAFAKDATARAALERHLAAMRALVRLREN